MHDHATYASYLDPEYLFLLNNSAQIETASITYLESLVKLSALFSQDLFLIDVMICDSRLLSKLFRNESFRVYLEQNKDFFKLIARPSEGYSENFEVVATPLLRCLSPTWNASTGFTEEIKEIAQMVLSLGRLEHKDWADPQSDIAKRIRSYDRPELRDFIVGLLFAIEYFSDSGTQRCYKPYGYATNTSTEVTYLAKLNDIATNDLRLETRSAADEALSLIHHHNREDDPRRSAIVQDIPLDVLRFEYKHVWGLIVHAWNMAIAESNGIAWRHMASIAGASIPIQDVAFGSQAIGEYYYPDAPNWVLRPSDLSWKDISNVVHATALSRVRMRTSLTSKAVEETLRETSDIMAKGLIKSTSNSILPWRNVSKKDSVQQEFAFGCVGTGADIAMNGLGTTLAFNFVPPLSKVLLAGNDKRRSRMVSGLIYKELQRQHRNTDAF